VALPVAEVAFALFVLIFDLLSTHRGRRIAFWVLAVFFSAIAGLMLISAFTSWLW
jgi:hypothetical protein